MKYTHYFVNDNGNLRSFGTESELELEHARIRYGNKLFFNRAECIADIKKPAIIKVRRLTPKEEYEQYVWGLSMMTPEEKSWVKEEQKTIDELQLEFAKEQMAKERDFA